MEAWKPESVSYTHLDVYKRQAYRQYGRYYWTGVVWPDRAENPGEAHAVARAWETARDVPVSYTHLDVYKRQVPDWADPEPQGVFCSECRREITGGQSRNGRKWSAEDIVGYSQRTCLLYTSRCV